MGLTCCLLDSGGQCAMFLEVDLPRLLGKVPLGIRRRMWYQHYGVPLRFAGPVRAVLTNTFGNRWIGRRGPVNFPSKSLDLTPLDIFLWGYTKNQVYATSVDSDMERIQRIHAAATMVKNTQYIFQRTRDTLLRRYRF